MKFEWDDNKHFSNKKKHGVGFGVARDFDWDNAMIVDEDAFDEERFIAYGHASDARGYVIVFQFVGEDMRIISVRRFTARENRILATDRTNMVDGVADDEMPELTPEKLRTARSFAELLAAKGIRRPGRPPSDDPKVRITIRLDAAVVEHFKDKGAGWQTRLNEALVDLVEAEKRPRPQQSRAIAFSTKRPAAKSAAKAPAKKAAPKASAKAAKPAVAKRAPAKKAASSRPAAPRQRKLTA